MTRQTSIDCYNQIKAEGLLSKRRLKVYRAIMKNAPCTTNEATKDLDSGSYGIGSRTTELRRLGVIYESGVRRCRVTGRNVIEWDLTDNLPKDIKLSTKTKKERTAEALIALRELYNWKASKEERQKWFVTEDLIKKI